MKPCARRSKNVVKPWLVEQWCLAPTADPAFASHMEDVLDVYQRPYAAAYPVICLDETSPRLALHHGWRPVDTPRLRRVHQSAGRRAVQYPDAEKLALVMDQLKIHTTASLYAAFPATEAHRLVSKLEIHHTPKHGSWLTMAELELSVLARQCLAQRLPDQDAMAEANTAWADRRNAAIHTIDWQFTTADARITLRRRYPEFDA